MGEASDAVCWADRYPPKGVEKKEQFFLRKCLYTEALASLKDDPQFVYQAKVAGAAAYWKFCEEAWKANGREGDFAESTRKATAEWKAKCATNPSTAKPKSASAAETEVNTEINAEEDHLLREASMVTGSTMQGSASAAETEVKTEIKAEEDPLLREASMVTG